MEFCKLSKFTFFTTSEVKQKCFIVQSVSRIWINKAKWLFSSQFWPLLKQVSFFETAGAVVEISSTYKLWIQTKLSLPKSLKLSVEISAKIFQLTFIKIFSRNLLRSFAHHLLISWSGNFEFYRVTGNTHVLFFFKYQFHNIFIKFHNIILNARCDKFKIELFKMPLSITKFLLLKDFFDHYRLTYYTWLDVWMYYRPTCYCFSLAIIHKVQGVYWKKLGFRG